MKINKIIIENFKPYYLKNIIDLTTNDNKNIIVIGGKNGGGKTSLLLAVVWCLYGSRLTDIDDIYKREIKGNYGSFLKESLNKKAFSESKNEFYVSLEICINNDQIYQINRNYNSISSEEKFDILKDKNSLNLSEEEKTVFIDNLIPIKAAKFVFFDAEKIADIADMNITNQGNIMNDILNKLLGLDIYEGLKFDFELYVKQLKSQNAKGPQHKEIEIFNNSILSKEKQIEEKLEKIDDLEETLGKLKIEINKTKHFLADKKINSFDREDIGSLHQRKTELELKKDNILEGLTELWEIIPFISVADKLNLVKEQLDKESSEIINNDKSIIFTKNTKAFLEKLFNKQPLPEDDISFENKSYYYSKAKELFENFDSNDRNIEELKFKHNISVHEQEVFDDLMEIILSNGKDSFDSLFEEIKLLENEINQLDRSILKAEGNSVDDVYFEYKEKLDDYQQEKERLHIHKGILEKEITDLKVKIHQDENKKERILNKVSINKRNKLKVAHAKKYIDVLAEFIDLQKNKKKESLQCSLLENIQLLFRKSNFIENVIMKFMPDNGGIVIELYDSNDMRIESHILSKGEQQMLISALLKSILNEAVKELPVFIDTPLARLDLEHKEKLLKHFYPNLAKQVIILSTDDEITSKRLKKIEESVQSTYILDNNNDYTTIQKGYF